MQLISLVCASYLMGMSSQSQIDYELTYVSDGFPDQPSNIFSSATDESHIISQHTVTSECITECSSNTQCLGYVSFDQPVNCVTLNNLGTVETTNQTALSFTKYARYDIRDQHTLDGYFWYSQEEHAVGQEHTVYIDMNHNGQHDDGEPLNNTNNNQFAFHDLPTGNYMVREIQTDSCTQIFPGAWGNNLMPSNGDPNFVNSVVQFYHSGHPTQVNFTGGLILDPEVGSYSEIANAQSGFILENTPYTFLSFITDDGIVLAFLNEVIEDGEGNDIIIHTFEQSTTKAHVSVSQNNIDYTTIGVLDDNTTEFDLANTSFSGKVAFVKLHFFNDEGRNDVRNIVGVEGTSVVEYFSPPYAIYATVPQVESLIFVKDCVYYYDCYTYCIFTRLTFDTIDSCMVGCDLWEETGTCNCPHYNTTDVPFYGEIYQPDQCFDGCSYKIQHEVYPDYTVRMHASGRPDQITSTVNCVEYDISGLSPNGCIMDAIDSCSRQPSCNALSLDDHMHGHLYMDHQYVDEENSYFLMKNQVNTSLERFTTPTTTRTTTQTRTATTTQTSTATTTQTETPTSTQTSTATTSQTSTATTTQTETPTTTQTTTPTTTQPPSESTAISSTAAALIAVCVLLAVIVLSVLAVVIINRNRKHREAMRKLEEAHRNPQPFINPVYGTGRKISGSSLVPNGKMSPVYLDVVPSREYLESPDLGSPRLFAASRSVSPVKIETNV